MRILMPHDVEWIIGKIREQGFEAFAVGGCVRDSLLGRAPEDWDITTSAKPEEIKAVFPKTVDTGLLHGTVTVMKNRRGFEVTTYRIDGEYHDFRHPDSVEFTSNLKEDLKRRDFTINAMAYSHETGVVDAFGGMADLHEGVIRCVGSPMDRFSEDALRILRAIRFAAQLGFAIDPETYEAVFRIAPNLNMVSRERVQVELTKILLSDHPEKIAMVRETGISKFVTEGFDQAFEGDSGSFACLDLLPREKSVRWAGFLRHLEPSQVRKVLRGLKLDNETIVNAKTMVEIAGADLPPQKPQIRRVLSRVTPYQFGAALFLKEMDGKPDVEAVRELWKEILRDGDCVSLKTLAVGGSDLIAFGMQPGKEMGEALARLLDLVLVNPELNEKERLLKKLKTGL